MKLDDALQQDSKHRSRGVLIAAHPLLEHREWENMNLPGLNGLEVVNIDSIWRQQWNQSIPTVLWSLLLLPFNPDLAYLRLFKEPNEEIAKWDEQLQKRFFIGVAGTDARANAIAFANTHIKFPSYSRMFRLFKNHIWLRSELTGELRSDKQKVMDAFSKGQFYFSFDLLGDPTGFEFFAIQKKQDFLPGEPISLSQGSVRLYGDLGREIELPHEVALYRDGQRITTSNRQKFDWVVTQPGAYRVVVRVIPTLPLPDGKVWLNWIYSNSIEVLK
jgi:hypothetical protein